jgi:peptidoglycan/xylan/chitin deacetylase (PgdA/CDA1 family)
MVGNSGRTWWCRWTRWSIVLVAVTVAGVGLLPAASVHGQAFQPQPPAETPKAGAQVCRPASPAIEKTPGRSVEVSRGPTECNAVHLSFDAGADRGYAEMVLDIVKDEQVPLSFGMTGLWAQQNPDLIQRMAEEGHEFINHTWSHRSFTGFSAGRPLSVAERRMDLDRTEELLVEMTGKSTRPYFRPPYGDRDAGLFKDVADAGYDYTMMWSVDSFGWRRIPAAAIVERCLSRAEPGAIFLLHVGIESEDGPALPALIAGLRGQGYQIVSMSDLLGL